jgi:hypothetical protein
MVSSGSDFGVISLAIANVIWEVINPSASIRPKFTSQSFSSTLIE